MSQAVAHSLTVGEAIDVRKTNQHTTPTEERMRVQGAATIVAIGKQEPSKEALDRFIEIYLEIVKENERKAAMLKING